MFIDLAPNRRPPEAVTPNPAGGPPTVPTGVMMSIRAGAPGHTAMQYRYTYTPDKPQGPAPSTVTWIDPSTPQSVFVNTGRNVLNSFNYLYDARHGKVGFNSVQVR